MYLVIDVGGTFIKHALMSSNGDILEKGKNKTPNKPDDTVEIFVEVIGGIYDIYKEKIKQGTLNVKKNADAGEMVIDESLDIEGIAMDLPGQIDVDKGIVYGGGALRYLHNTHLQSLISERCDGHRVALENDGKAAALAEVWKGNAKDTDDSCVLIFGTGVGGAVIKDRKVHRGKHLLAGEVSFAISEMKREDIDRIRPIEELSVSDAMENVPFFWSAHASTMGMCHKLAKKKGLDEEAVNGELAYEWAAQGDGDAIEALEDMYFSIAKQCCNLYVIYDPEIILIGGGISAQPQFFQGICRYVDELKRISIIYKDIRIDLCKYLSDSNLLGALYNFMQKYD